MWPLYFFISGHIVIFAIDVAALIFLYLAISLFIMKTIIGRIAEQSILANALVSDEAELIAVFGRRRVGKTYLIREYYNNQMIFDFSGVHNESLQKQLTNFRNTMAYTLNLTIRAEVPSSWTDAFFQLRNFTEPLIAKKKGVIFLDEFPWLNSPRSVF